MVPVTLLALTSLPPVPILRRMLRHLMEVCAVWAIRADTCIWRTVSGTRIEWVGQPPPKLTRNCIVLSNHQSWTDILLLQDALAQRTPPLKWLAKRQLLYVPIIGLICWAYGYPLLRRYTPEQLATRPELRARDRATVQACCQELRSNPGTIINFPEGTRYTEEKSARLESPFQHLLPARTGGLFTLVDLLDGELEGILDITIQYPQLPPSLWDFLGGRYACVRMRCDFIPARDLPLAGSEEECRDALQKWLENRWHLKDDLLAGFLNP